MSMKVKQIISGTLTLMVWAIGMQGVAFVYDMFDSTLTSPVWDPTYNWAPFLIGAFVFSLFITTMRLYIASRRPVYRIAHIRYASADLRHPAVTRA